MSDINYNKDRVDEGLELIKEYQDDLESVQELVTEAFTLIKGAKGYLEIKSKLLIKQKDIEKLLKINFSEFTNLAANISNMQSLIEKFDETEIDKMTEPPLKEIYNNETITTETIESAITNNFSNNQNLTNMFNMNLYNELQEELKKLDSEEGIPNGNK